MVLVRLAGLTGELAWQDLAERQLSFVAGNSSRYPAGYSFSLLAISELLYPAGRVVCCSRMTPPAGFLNLMERSHAYVVVETAENAEALAAVAPYTAVYPLPDEGVVMYFCRDGACSLPVTTLEELERLIGA